MSLSSHNTLTLLSYPGERERETALGRKTCATSPRKKNPEAREQQATANNMMAPRLLLLAALPALVLLLAPRGALAVAKTEEWRDHTLNQAGPACIAEFYRTMQGAYAPRDACAVPVQQAFAGSVEGACPGNMTFVQQCLTVSFTGSAGRSPEIGKA